MIVNKNKYFKILNVAEDSSVSIIKQTTKKLLKKYHPDQHPKHKDWAETQTKRILEAYKILVKDIEHGKNQEKRIIYQPHIRIILKEKKSFFIETIVPENDTQQKVYFDVSLIDRVISSLDLTWVREPVMAKFGEFNYYLINRLIYSEGVRQLDNGYKVLLFKPVFVSNYRLALGFVSGGKVTELLDNDCSQMESKKVNDLELKFKENDYYITPDVYKNIERLLLEKK
ncbi:MAG: DnaJ domain-containing protein [Candidatus Margulisbacteria bacterium]|nr:DnaJ domain-containing protein [Candidatus Margulisiibacteriota bacterium]